MRSKFRTLTRLALAGFIAFGAGLMNVARAGDAPSPPIEQTADGSVTLGAMDAKIDGPNARIEGGDTKSIAWWTNVDTSLHWTAKIDKPGRYRVELNFFVLSNATHGELTIAVGDQKTVAILQPGSGMNDFKWGQAGEITISKAGELTVTATPLSKSHECVTYLRAIMLRPADSPSHAIDVTGAPIKPADDGTFKLPALDAEIDGMNAVIEGGAEKFIGFWKYTDTSLNWKIAVQKPGKYRVELNYSLLPDCEGSKVAILVGGQSVIARPKAGADWKDYKEGKVGEVTISGTGYFPVVVKPVSKPGEYVCNLRSVTLAPADLPTTAPDISDQPIQQANDGSIMLTADQAEIDGEVARLEGGDKKYIVWRGSRVIGITWPAIVDKPGRYNVMVTYSLAKVGSSGNVSVAEKPGKYNTVITYSPPADASSSNEVTLSAGGKSVTGGLPPTHGWDNFKTAKLGTIEIQNAGALQVAMTSSMEPGLRIINLRSVELAPASR